MIKFLTAIFVFYIIFMISLNLSITYLTFSIIVAILSLIVLIASQIRRETKKNNNSYINYNNIDKTMNIKVQKYMPLIYFIIVFLFSVVYWFGNFPGGFNLDAYGQWLQAHGNMQYNDWHPFVSTLLIQLIIQISDSFFFYIVIQIIAFSIAVSYLLYCIQRQGVNYRLLLGISFFIGLNPAIGLNTVCMTKDAQFTILIVLLTGTFIRIVSTDGKWLNNFFHLLGISILSVLILLVRHNGILFIVPAFFTLLMFYPSRIKIFISCIFVFLIVVLIKGPIRTTLNVEAHENVLGETMGIPMGMMANALIDDEENLPQEVHAFLNTIATDEQWKENYVTGEWDSCKWNFGGIELLKNYTASEILKYTASTIRMCPQACYDAFRENTRIIWSLFSMSASWVPYVYVEVNEVGIDYSPINSFHEISSCLMMLSQHPFISFIFWNLNIYFIVMLFLWTMMKKNNQKTNLLLVFPLFTYIVGTMLLLSGPNQRYFYCGLVLMPPIIVSMIYSHRKEKYKL